MDYYYEYRKYSKYTKKLFLKRICVGDDGNFKYKKGNKCCSDTLYDVSEFDFDKALVYKFFEYDKKFIDTIDGKYELLPMGYKNNLSERTFGNEDSWSNCHYFEDTLAKSLLNSVNPKWSSIFYDKDANIVKSLDIGSERWSHLIQSYIDYYKKSLGEEWTYDRFLDMISSLKYLSVQYARNIDTGEVIPVGFFGSYIKYGANGKSFSDAELYVMPDFRGLGISKKLVYNTFENGLRDGVNNFESVTYRTHDFNAFDFWGKIGASVSGLIHIDGDVDVILEKLGKQKEKNIISG